MPSSLEQGKKIWVSHKHFYLFIYLFIYLIICNFDVLTQEYVICMSY